MPADLPGSCTDRDRDSRAGSGFAIQPFPRSAAPIALFRGSPQRLADSLMRSPVATCSAALSSAA